MAEEETQEKAEVRAPLVPDPSGLLTQHQRAVQAALQASQEQAVRVCLACLDPMTRADEGTYADALRRLQAMCQTMLDRLEGAPHE
jgi:hypothetical protein